MRIKVLSTNLSKSLSRVSHALPSNPLVPTLENFLFVFDGSKLTISATDLQTSLSSKASLIEYDAEGEDSIFEIAVPAKILHETVKAFPEQVLDIHINMANFAFTVYSANGTYKLIGESAHDFPKFSLDNEIVKTSLELESNLLKQLLSTVTITMSKDEMKPSLNGLCIDVEGSCANFVATDTFKLCKYQLMGVDFQKLDSPIVISRKSVMILLSILNSDTLVNFSLSDDFFFGTTQGCNFACRLVKENFPKYDNVIPVENNKILQINRAELLKSLKRIAIFANKSTRYVSLSLSQGQVTLTAEDLDFSNAASEILMCEYNDEELLIGFNINSLIEILSVIRTDEIKFKFSASNKACLIIPIIDADSMENILILLMPILLNVHK